MLWGNKGKKVSQKGLFMDAESVRKTLKIFNVIATKGMLMKLTTDKTYHDFVSQ